MSTLREEVQGWLDEQTAEGYESAGSDLLQYGCQSGMVGSLVYYSDTVAFYDRHREEIDAMLAEMVDDTGLQPADLFGEKWDKSDPLARGDLNRNLLAWFGFEETARRIIEG